MTQLDENEKLLTYINTKNNEVCDSYVFINMFIYNLKNNHYVYNCLIMGNILKYF